MTANSRSSFAGKSHWGVLAIVVVAVLLSFSAGLLVNLNFGRGKTEQGRGDRVFQLMIYHTRPGKAVALEAVFRNGFKLQAQHHLNVIGHWVPNDDPAWKDTFIYLVAHASRAEADAHWNEFHTDPAFPALRKAAARLIQQVNGDYRVDEVFMRPSDYSAMK